MLRGTRVMGDNEARKFIDVIGTLRSCLHRM